MIYTHDNRTALNPAMVVMVEIKDRGDRPDGNGRDVRVIATDTNGGVHQLTPYRATTDAIHKAFDRACAQVERAIEGRPEWASS